MYAFTYLRRPVYFRLIEVRVICDECLRVLGVFVLLSRRRYFWTSPSMVAKEIRRRLVLTRDHTGSADVLDTSRR